jgi:transcriptional regulator with XRE-family HTH domain
MSFGVTDRSRGGIDRRMIGHVKADETGAEFAGGGLPAPGVARADIDGVPSRDQLAGGFVSEALVSPGDECDCHVIHPAAAPDPDPGNASTRMNSAPAVTLKTWTNSRWHATCGRGAGACDQAVGLPSTPRRRTPGLRREELASLAGVSAECIARLEQGRAAHPSPQVLSAIARALRLSATETGHMHLGLGDHLLNPLWAALLGDPASARGRERNFAWRHFTGLPTHLTHTADALAEFEHDMVCDLRRKTANHPLAGPVTVDCDVLAAPDGDLYVVVFAVEPGSQDASRLDLLRVTGTQSFASAG